MEHETDYEKQRDDRIKRNQEIMKSLGLDQMDFMLHCPHGNGKTASGEGKVKKHEKEPRRVGVKRDASTAGEDDDDTAAVLPTRRSQRLKGEGPEFATDTGGMAWLPRVEDRKPRACGKKTIVGTASYEHTLMRVQTMSEKALSNRVRAIERAKGQHAVVKMRLFARILCLEGYEELSWEATEALQRLIAALGDNGGDEELDVDGDEREAEEGEVEGDKEE